MPESHGSVEATESHRTARWTPFRPTPQDRERIAREVSSIPAIQQRLLERHPDLSLPDRVAHQYQIVGSPVRLSVERELPDVLEGVGLFAPGAEHHGIGRISMGLGCPHLETDPDFLGLMLAFRAPGGKRVDLLAINDPSAPADDHREFMELLAATADAAGSGVPMFGGIGERDVLNLAASQGRFSGSLLRRLGTIDGLKALLHIVAQTRRTLHSSTAFQTYWSGIVETGGWPGKVVFEPLDSGEPGGPGLRPGERHLTEDWKRRQAAGPLRFRVSWIPFQDHGHTPLTKLTRAWKEDRRPLGTVTFPRLDPASEEARLWGALATEMGANPGHWIHDADDTIPEPATEFEMARKLAYQASQRGRDALPEEAYAGVFTTGTIDGALAAELERRRERRERLRHVSEAPTAFAPR